MDLSLLAIQVWSQLKCGFNIVPNGIRFVGDESTMENEYKSPIETDQTSVVDKNLKDSLSN